MEREPFGDEECDAIARDVWVKSGADHREEAACGEFGVEYDRDLLRAGAKRAFEMAAHVILGSAEFDTKVAVRGRSIILALAAGLERKEGA